MESETLRNIRTMRQVRSSLETADRRRPRTTNSLTKTAAEIDRPGGLPDRRLERVLSRERQRAAALESSVENSRRRLLRAREKLAATINRNRALTALRHELQRARWAGEGGGAAVAAGPARKNTRLMDINY